MAETRALGEVGDRFMHASPSHAVRAIVPPARRVSPLAPCSMLPARRTKTQHLPCFCVPAPDECHVQEQDIVSGPVAKLEAKWQEREAEKMRRREAAALVSDPAENAHVFWQVRMMMHHHQA